MQYICLECGEFYEGDEVEREFNICPDCHRRLDDDEGRSQDRS